MDASRVRSVLEDSIGSVKGTLKDPVCRIGIGELEHDRYTISLQVWVDAHGYQDTRFLLQEKIMNDLKTAGVIAAS